MTDFATDREVKTQYRQNARIYHPDKYDQTSTQMKPRQSEEHFKTNKQRVRISAKYFVIFLYDIISVMTHDLICYVFFFAQYLL